MQKFPASDGPRYGPFVAMELMEQGDLATYLRKIGDTEMGTIDPTQAYLWAVQIADGMAYLERKKIVHRWALVSKISIFSYNLFLGK